MKYVFVFTIFLSFTLQGNEELYKKADGLLRKRKFKDFTTFIKANRVLMKSPKIYDIVSYSLNQFSRSGIKEVLAADFDISILNNAGVLPETVRRENIDLAKTFIEMGVDVNSVDHKGYTSLNYVKDEELRKLLLSKSAKLGEEVLSVFDLVCQDKSDLLKEMLKRDKLAATRYNRYRWWPIHFAAQIQNSKCLPILLESKVQLNEQNSLGWTPLMHAAYYGNIENVGLLLKAGADTSIKTALGYDASKLARWKGNRAIVSLLEGGSK